VSARRARLLLAPLVVRPARRDRLRFALTVSGVAVGVATMAAIRLANASVLSSFSRTVDFVAGRASLTVLSSGAGIPEQTLSRLGWLRRSGATLAPALAETAALGTADGEVVEVLGIDPLADGEVRAYAFVSGGASITDAARVFAPDAVMVTDVFAARHGLKVGDAFPLLAGGSVRTMNVAAVLASEGVARAASGSILFADLATVQEMFGKLGRLDRIDVVLPQGTPDAARREYAEEIRASLPPDATVGRPERRTETVDKMVRAFRVNLTALGLIALLVGVYFVYNTLSISVLRRRTEIGTVRALGASARAVFTVFLAEGAALGLVGSLLGTALGIALAEGALLAVGGTATEFYMPSAHPVLSLDPAVLLSSLLIGTLASAASALAPALEAARVEPAATLRHGSVEAARRRAVRPLAIAGVLLLVLGALASRPGPVRGLPLFGFASILLLVLGVSLLAPLAVVSAARVLARPVRALGVSAGIARANLTGSLSRTAVAVAALTMGISMMVSVAVMVGSFRSTVARWVGETLSADLFIAPASGGSHPSFGRLPDEALDAIAHVPGVADVDAYLAFSATAPDGAPYTIASGRFRYLAEHENLPLVDGRDTKRVLAGALASDEALVSEPYAEKFRRRTGDVVELPTPRGSYPVRIAGIYTDYSNDRGTVTVDRALFARLYPLVTGATSVAVTLTPGLPPEEGRRRVEAATRGRFALRIRTNATLRREVLRVFDRTFAVTYALEAVAIAVAVLGVFNTLVALVLERRREIGLLRVLGASAKRVAAAVRWEAVAIGGLGALLGLLAGAAMSVVLVHVVNRQSFGWTIAMHWPVGFLAAALAGILATTLLAAHHPARLAAATDAAEALKEE
jgi:putative ABC transport system permease protein